MFHIKCFDSLVIPFPSMQTFVVVSLFAGGRKILFFYVQHVFVI